MHKNLQLSILLLSLFIAISACKSQPTPTTTPAPTSQEVEQKLYNEYKAGEIQRCQYEGNTVYICSRNAPDAGSEIFDAKGEKIGGCYYNTGAVDPICKSASDCKVIYRIARNIWGKPGVELEALK